MSIHRKDGARGERWEVRWREGGRNRSRTLRSEIEAVAFQAEINRRQGMGAFAPAEPSPLPLREYLEIWFRTSGVQWAHTTRVTRGYLIDKWIDPFIGHVPLRELGRARVKEYRAGIIRAGSRPTNTVNVMRVLSAALGVAEEDGFIPVNPCRRLGAVRQDRPKRDAIPEEILFRLIDSAPTARDAAIIAACGLAGLRPAEMVALRWDDTDGGVIHVHESVQGGERGPVKNGKPRSIPIESALDAALARAREMTSPGAGVLVAPGARGGYLNWSMWGRKVWQPLCAKAGLGRIAPYSLRHTAISRWIARGEDLMTVSTWAGHGPDVTLKVYAHQFQQAKTQAARTDPAAP